MRTLVGLADLASGPIAAQSTSSTPAIVAAVAAVVAAVVAASSTFGIEAWRGIRSRRGVAGLLAEDLHRWEGTIVEAYYRDRWWYEGELLAEQATQEDLKLAATALTPSQWSALSSARRWVHYLEAVRRRRAAAEGERRIAAAADPPNLGNEERRWLAETFYRLEAARWGLHQSAARRLRRSSGSLAGSWRSYRQDQLAERFSAPVEDRLQTLNDPAVLDALLGEGVSSYVSNPDRAKTLVPENVRQLGSSP